MKRQNKSNSNREVRRKRVRARVIGSAKRPRLSVFRSSGQMFAQLIDDGVGKTIASIHTKKISAGDAGDRKAKTAAAYLAGKKLAEKAVELKIKDIVFDRAGYKYHGRVKALADGARNGGLNF